MAARCRCDGRYIGCDHGEICMEESGGYRSPLFCEGCDERRIITLTKDFKRLRTIFSDQETTEK